MRRFLSLALAIAALATVAAGPVAARPSRTTIVDAAIAANASGEFEHLVDAVVRAGLAETVDGNRQFTVFAPTDAAFETLFATLGVRGVDEIPVATLRTVLLYHVAPGERFSGDVLASTRIRTMAGAFAYPSVSGGTAWINDARIVVADLDVANGVIHVIDNVILPGA